MPHTVKRLLFASALCVFGLLLAAIFYLNSLGLDVPSGVINLLRPHPDPAPHRAVIPSLKQYKVSWLANIEPFSINESSGLASSQVHPDILWTINDSGAGSELYALDLTGNLKQTFSVPGVSTMDWESLDALVYQGRPAILIADSGDNLRWRASVNLHLVAEPETLEVGAELELLKTIQVTFPHGPRDVEAVAIDAQRARILLLSKRTTSPEMYAVPLTAGGAVEASQVALLESFPKTTEQDYARMPEVAPYLHMPSGMDIHENRLLITTYQHVVLYELPDLTHPLHIEMPLFGQREAISFDRTGNKAFLTRERTGDDFAAEIIAIEFLP